MKQQTFYSRILQALTSIFRMPVMVNLHSAVIPIKSGRAKPALAAPRYNP